MKTVTITESFTGYPNDKKRAFVAGETPELSDAYADLIIGKGLGTARLAKSKSEPAAADPVDGQKEKTT